MTTWIVELLLIWMLLVSEMGMIVRIDRLVIHADLYFHSLRWSQSTVYESFVSGKFFLHALNSLTHMSASSMLTVMHSQ